MTPNVFSLSKRAITYFSATVFLAVLTASGATISWTNLNGGAWSVATNWNPNIVPRPTDTVQITAAGTYTIMIDTAVSILSFTLGNATGTQTLTNTSQTITLANSSSVVANGILSLGGGTLTGGSLSIQGTFNWAGATVASSLTVTTIGVLNFSGNGGTIQGPLTNSGTINWSGVSASLALYNNHAAYTGVVYNQSSGLFNLQSDQSFNCACYGFEVFNNAGTIRKTAGVGTSSFSLTFTNTGTVDAQSGTIRFAGGGNVGGTYNTASGAIIEFDSGNFTETGAVSVTGSGTCRLNGATVTLNDRITKFILFAGNVMLSPTFETGGTIQSLQLDGAYLLGTNLVTGTLGINGGGLATASSLTVSPGGVLNFNGAALNIYSPLTNSGTVNWSGGGITVYNNNNAPYTGIINNQPTGLFNLQNDQNLSAAGYGFETFRNFGTVRKSAGLGTSTFSLAFTNSGTIDAETGIIRFSTGGNLGGIYNTASGAFIEFTSGSFIQNALASVTGSGTCRLNGANATLNDRIAGFVLFAGNVALTPTFETNGTIQNLQLDGAYLLGTNVVTGTLGINGGGLATSSALTIAPAGMLNFNGAAANIYSPLTNSGTVNWSGAGLTVYNNSNAPYAGVINNQPTGLFNLQNDQALSAAGYGFETFRNFGIVRKLAGVGTSTFSLAFTNFGTIDAQSGTIQFNSGGNLASNYNTASGAFIQFNSGSFIHNGPVTVAGSGICRLNGATATLNDRIANFLLISGNVGLTPAFETNGTIQNLQLDGAYLLGTNVVTGTLGINGGGLASVSPLTVAPGGVLNFNGASVNLYSPLTNAGTINWSSGTLTVYNNNANYSSIINNQSTGLFNIQSDQGLSAAGYGFESMTNAGTIRKTAGLGTTTINFTFANTGTLDIQSGILRFSGPYSQTGGVMNFGITSLAYYGQIAFNANAPFTGNLSANFNSGYAPSPGDSFNLVSYTTHSNAFTSVSLPASAQWQTNYGNTVFSIIVLSVNAGAGNVSLTPISDRAINAGATLLITNTATDSNPSNQISYSLTTAPAGATIGSSSGIMQWRAPVASAGIASGFTVKATDNGIPPASDSKSFNVTVNPIAPVTLNAISYISNHFTLRINGFVGPDYTLQTSTNLINWAVLSTSTPSSMPVTNVDNNAVVSTNHFYRVRLGP